MESTSSSGRSPNYVVDIEKGLPLSLNDPYGSSQGSPEHHSSPKAVGSSSSAAFAVAPLASLKRLFERNPSAVVSGRYTINFRQLLILLCILISLTLLWFFSDSGAAEVGLDKARQRLNPPDRTALEDQVEKEQHIPQQPVHVDPYNERYDRVRGKGTRTSLKKIQFAFGPESQQDRVEREGRLKAVRDGFEHAWSGYKKHAWGHDEVRPVSGGYRNQFNGWGATMIDSLDTLVIMGFNKEFDEALEWVKTSFNMRKDTTAQLQFFETIIRYLGGLLSAYDLTGEKVLLDKAEELGNYMLNAFQGRIMPDGRVAVAESANRNSPNSFVLAEVGTIQLEFSRLSMLTKNPIYDQKAQKIFEALGSATSDLPGLLPSYVQDGMGRHYSNYRATVGGMVDSYYEYLLKEWILLDGKPTQYKETFEKSVNSMHKYMVMTPDNGSKEYAILGAVSSGTKDVDADMEHLACFIAGSLAMSSKYYDRPDDMILAKQVAEGCYLGYHHSVTGIGPEAMKFHKGRESKTFVANPQTFYAREISRSEYILRPETLESLWILYRLTGEKKYQDQAWEIFQSLEKSCRTNIAYSGLKDVNRPGSHDDKMESFFLAETMKYLYLMFSTPDVISLDNFVLNTEAHPFRRT
ncbi:hypothetical protein BX616_001340 [Lobosporangium transversale]|uniref:alpha-1,2-Mannosidase n=1 Tax=Lobosporangium transversale TaxID=64571 RepID=A0A1Y2GQE8_9FUNG|nr:glycosyl hydrolase family 47-domain-containing protein [Lobosporangium transversale]KAF9904341.1 hypothetical protein BX616_001340 [Lobosporangium transversale]ORZ17475.1 glycosyl hydrolase family 47-domain-containing protein [Lobosporangium transversale]|eukprot:XP_021881862.1 glycosyl hydrolase family 47-domain-containing protein [Lobosporangium transversale]